ncbi:MAG: PLDc N-terminal domain-containing protein [Propionivibrio sp.]|uniref:phospholipase D-like domain-containing protein n=1 Tax=Propionivibrio sp. TaxID=2212460 RepID=UPI001A640A1A|nr:phospholipase D-like domain-containing protein [Propionivibrio sp.]MBL8414369.1 PLDc N-terminal domain-containing protein [Propionivibrio sp.]
MSEFVTLFAGLINRHWEVLYGLLVVVGLGIYVAASQGLHQRRHPAAAIAWVLGIVLLPYVTLPLYLTFGSRKVLAPHLAKGSRRVAVASRSTHATAGRAQQLCMAMGLPDPVAYVELGIHEDGTQALVALRRIIDGASWTLEVSTFVFGRDVLGDEIAERLKQRARAGVRVRLLIDGIGIYLGGYPDLKGFAEAGVEVVRFVPPFRSPKRGRTNLRNHRKMVIADGLHLWCGGRNLSAEYFEGDPRPILGSKPWLDLSFDLGGELARQAQQQFEQDWAFATERPLPEPRSFATPAPASCPLAQLVASGPDQPDDTLFTLLVSSCFTSEQRILAVTPYFVPDTALLTALTLAARRGIEIDLVLPARSNHRLADFARHRSLRDLVAAGAKVWLHPRMIHAKAVLIDDELALAGSANLDGRSLFLNYEMTIAFYDRQAVSGFVRWIDARRLESEAYAARRPSLLRELAEGLILWLAFQL